MAVLCSFEAVAPGERSSLGIGSLDKGLDMAGGLPKLVEKVWNKEVGVRVMKGPAGGKWSLQMCLDEMRVTLVEFRDARAGSN